MNIGDQRMERPSFSTSYGANEMPPQRCEVIYIHPEKRYYRVRFPMPGGQSITESFILTDRT